MKVNITRTAKKSLEKLDRNIQKRILFTLACLFVFVLGKAIIVPGIDKYQLGVTQLGFLELNSSNCLVKGYIQLEVLPEPRKELSKYAPKIISFTINPEKIKDVIGSGGKTINKIIDETGVKIDIDDDGLVMVASTNAEMNERAKQIIQGIACDIEVGKTYTGKVERIMQFGAFVDLGYGKEGMIHISKLSSKRVEKVEDVVKVGDTVVVECIKIDDKERVDLKLIAVESKWLNH